MHLFYIIAHLWLTLFVVPLQIFTNAFPVHYSPPHGFHFEVDDADDFVPVQVLAEIKD